MKRFVLVYNPVSGNGKNREKLDWIIESFQRRDSMIIPYRTKKSGGCMADFIREAAPDGVIVMGGDGTLSEVAREVSSKNLNTPIAIFGSGTSNDFANYLNVNADQDSYIDRIAAGFTHPSDVGAANGKIFVNVVSAGVLTSVAHEVSVKMKHAIGKSAYYISGLGQIPNFHSMNLTVESENKIYELEAYFFIVANSSVVAGLKNAAALADIDDGKLDFIAVRKCPAIEFASLTRKVFAGGADPNDKNIFYLQSSHFRISSSEPAESDLDGEPGPSLPLDVSVIRRGLSFFV